jgi:hypothetical protein
MNLYQNLKTVTTEEDVMYEFTSFETDMVIKRRP